METILAKDLKNELEKKEMTILDVYADWCGPCKMLRPVLEQLSKDMPEVNFIKIDSDRSENRDLLRELRVSSIPAIFYYKKNKLMDSHVGFLPAEQIIEKIEAIRKK